MGHGSSIGTSERSHSRRSVAGRLILRSRATAVRGGGVPVVVRGRESRPHVIVPLPDSISASALAAPSAPMIQNVVKPRRASTEATRRGAGSRSRIAGSSCWRGLWSKNSPKNIS
jgi:hypothetical protein